MVKLGVVDEDSVAEVGVEVEQEAVGVDVRGERQGVGEGVTEPGIHRGHPAAPQRGVHYGLLNVQGERLLSHALLYSLSPHLRAEAADELPRRQVGGVLPPRAGDVRTEGDSRGRNPGLNILVY